MHSIAAILQVTISNPGPDPVLEIEKREGKVNSNLALLGATKINLTVFMGLLLPKRKNFLLK